MASPLDLPAVVWLFPGRDVALRLASSAVGEQSHQVLAEIGIEGAGVDRLVAAGTVVQAGARP